MFVYPLYYYNTASGGTVVVMTRFLEEITLIDLVKQTNNKHVKTDQLTHSCVYTHLHTCLCDGVSERMKVWCS